MTDDKTVTITVDGTDHVIKDVTAVEVKDNGTLVIYGYGQGVVKALGPSKWEEFTAKGTSND